MPASLEASRVVLFLCISTSYLLRGSAATCQCSRGWQSRSGVFVRLSLIACPSRPSNPVGHFVFLFLWFLRRTPTESNPVLLLPSVWSSDLGVRAKIPSRHEGRNATTNQWWSCIFFSINVLLVFSFSSSRCLYFCEFLSVNCHPCGLLLSFYLAIFQCSDWSTAFVCPEMAWHNENWVISHLTLAQKKLGTLNFRTQFQNIVLGSGGHSQKRRPTKTDEIVSHLSIIDNGLLDGRAPNAGQKKQQKTRHCPAAGHCRIPSLSKECGSCARLRKETLVVCDLKHLSPTTVCRALKETIWLIEVPPHHRARNLSSNSRPASYSVACSSSRKDKCSTLSQVLWGAFESLFIQNTSNTLISSSPCLLIIALFSTRFTLFECNSKLWVSSKLLRFHC